MPSTRVTAHLLKVGPHAGAHRVATRAAVSVGLPLLAVVLLGHPEWSAYACFGGFTALYGRRSSRAERAGMQVMAGLAFWLTVVAGVVVSMLPHHRWWMVGIGALVAAGGTMWSQAWDWHPPGALFLVFSFTVCAFIPGQGTDTIAVAAVTSGGAALFAIFVGWVGELRHRNWWTMPRLRPPTFSDAVATPSARRQLARYFLATATAGSLAQIINGAHPYWAMISVCASVGGITHDVRVALAILRSVGTLAGILVAGALLSWHPSILVMVAMIAVLQFTTELLIGRNYGLGVAFITPMAIVLGQLSHEQSLGHLLADRMAETLLGAAVAVAITFLIPEPRDAKEANKSSDGSAPAR